MPGPSTLLRRDAKVNPGGGVERGEGAFRRTDAIRFRSVRR
jgi:hypothetical protein